MGGQGKTVMEYGAASCTENAGSPIRSALHMMSVINGTHSPAMMMADCAQYCGHSAVYIRAIPSIPNRRIRRIRFQLEPRQPCRRVCAPLHAWVAHTLWLLGGHFKPYEKQQKTVYTSMVRSEAIGERINSITKNHRAAAMECMQLIRNVFISAQVCWGKNKYWHGRYKLKPCSDRM